jgi:hypothetical protein
LPAKEFIYLRCNINQLYGFAPIFMVFRQPPERQRTVRNFIFPVAIAYFVPALILSYNASRHNGAGVQLYHGACLHARYPCKTSRFQLVELPS